MNAHTHPIPILAVDDLPENLLVFQELLSGDNQVVLCAQSGEDALRLLLKHDFALILMDVQMPGMNGFEAAELIRGDVHSCHIPIVFVTAGAADIKNRFNGYESGAVDYLIKPIEALVLQSKVKVFADLYTQRKQLEMRSVELQDALRAAESSLRAKTAFLTNVGHEIRTPMNAIIGTTHLVLHTGLTDQQRGYLETIDSSAKSLLKSINNILEFSYLDGGKVVAKPTRFRPREILNGIMDSIRPLVQNSGLELHCEIDPALPVRLFGDALRLSQILNHIIDNALKFTPSGCISIRASKLCESNGCAQIRFEVQDTGIGISTEDQVRIFETFAQVDESTTRRYEGTGLGLAISRQLCILLGGVISVESHLGQGSLFRVDLPFVLHSPLPGTIQDQMIDVSLPVASAPQSSGPLGSLTQLQTILTPLRASLASRKPCREHADALRAFEWPDAFALDLRNLASHADNYHYDKATALLEQVWSNLMQAANDLKGTS